jgi:nucleoside-diphosphate-sugar epimerase
MADCTVLAPGCLIVPLVEQIRHRRVPLIGGGTGWVSFVHVDDAPAATVRAIDCGKPGNIYSIVDDDPRSRYGFPRWLGCSAPSRRSVYRPGLPGSSRRTYRVDDDAEPGGSNAKAKTELGWQPAHPSWRQGFAEVAKQSMEGSTAA